MNKSKYCIPVAWTVDADLHIEAESLDEAIEIATAAPLPEKAVFRNGSFEVYEEDATMQVKACYRSGVDKLPASKKKPKNLGGE